MRAQPIEHGGHQRRRALRLLAALRRLPAPTPAHKLALGIPFRPAEIAEPNFRRHNPVQIGERFNQRFADTPIELRLAGELVRNVIADDKSVPAFLDDEDGADDTLVLAQQQTPGRQRELPV